MPDELFITRARLTLRQAYGVAARALEVLHRRGLAEDTVSLSNWDPAHPPLDLGWTCTSDQLLRALDARQRDADTPVAQQRTGYPLVRLCAVGKRWRLIVEWPDDLPFDPDPAIWDRAMVEVRIMSEEDGGWLRYLQDLRLTQSIGKRKYSRPEVVLPLHRAAALRRIADIAAEGVSPPVPVAGGLIAGHLFTTRPGAPFELLDALCGLGLLGRDGWIIREARVVVCGDLIHSPNWSEQDERLPLLRWLAAHHPDHVQLVPGEADWANLDAPDVATGELRRLAATGRVRGALAVGLLADGEALLVPRFLTTSVPAPWNLADEAGGLARLADALDQLIRVQRFISPATSGDDPTGVEGPSAARMGPRQLMVTGGNRDQCDPLNQEGAWLRLLHGQEALPLALDQPPDLPVSQLTVQVESQREQGVIVDIAGPVPAESRYAWLDALLMSLDGDTCDFLWNCSCGDPGCANIRHRVRIQHLGDSTLWTWPRPLSGGDSPALPMTWVTVRFTAAAYRGRVLTGLRALRDRAAGLVADPALSGTCSHDAEWMASWTLPDA